MDFLPLRITNDLQENLTNTAYVEKAETEVSLRTGGNSENDRNF